MANINRAVVVKTEVAYRCPTCGNLFIATNRCPECGQKVESQGKRDARMAEKVAMVRAMETVCRNLNDEDILMTWLAGGVADGDITKQTSDADIASEYCEDDDEFAKLMDCFLRCMKWANESGGLYCGDVVSNIGEEDD